jgi:hypothetical protein
MTHITFCYLIYEVTEDNNNILTPQIESNPLIEEERRLINNVFRRSAGDITGIDEDGAIYLITPFDETPYNLLKWGHLSETKEIETATIANLENYESCSFHDRDNLHLKFWINNY